MTFAEAKTAVLEGLKEQVSSRGLIPDNAALERWVNMANGAIWAGAIGQNPRAWILRSEAATWDPAQGYLTMDELVASLANPLGFPLGTPGVHHIRYLEYQDPTDSRWKPIVPFESEDTGLLEPVSRTFQPRIPSRWYVEGDLLYLSPPPDSGLAVRCRFVPLLPTLTAAGEWLLLGRHTTYHDLVVLKTLQLLWRKDEEKTTPWDTEVADGTRDFYHAIRRTQGMRTRRVRRVSHY